MRQCEESPFHGLSFVQGPNIWATVETRDWGTDNRKGSEYAGELIAHLRKTGRHRPLLGHIVREIIERGRFGGVECGFFHRIADELSRTG